MAQISIDGQLSDWTNLDRVDFNSTVAVTGYQIFGRFESGTLNLALKTNGTDLIGLNSTIWLDTDANPLSGYRVFGTGPGAEYAIEFTQNGVLGAVPQLFSVNATTGVKTLVGDLTFSYGAGNTDKSVIELAVKTSDIGNTGSVNFVADLNDLKYLPTAYTQGYFNVTDLPPRTDSSFKIGIVFSETSAAKYFSSTAYSQLIMSVQSQAQAAGIPFDILTEADLTDMAKVANYDTLVFPSFQYVDSSKAAAIESVLTNAVYHYGISLVAAGNFMTNDQNTQPLSNDVYARMKLLLGVQRTGGEGSLTSVTLKAAGAGTTDVTGYAAGDEIHVYKSTATSLLGAEFYSGVNGATTQTVATQTTSNGTTQSAILATQTGGNNVYFATEAFLADNNALQHALQWTVKPAAGPELQLHMSRFNSLTASRTDMDQSQEHTDVVGTQATGGIYDKLLPILQQWKDTYNFVGSYYINIGNNQAQQQFTDWAKSKPYYQAILAMGNEIGSHSYTHPEDTNVLNAQQIQFEFETSKSEIEQQLGITLQGAAVPGAPETLATSEKILQYYSYLTGGYSGIGAGYPNAFGYLTPQDAAAGKIYIAPNMKFDFSLVEAAPEYGGGLSPAAALAEWKREFDELSSKSDMPVMVWPWHDYGPTQWITNGVSSPYTLDMFSSFIGYAASKGTEFVTLADLADRIRAFEAANFHYSFDSMAGTITATVSSSGNKLGTFALDLDGAQTVASVSGWYAYDSDSVFLPSAGGTYTIKIGTPEDVTHITDLPARAQLASLTGDGRNLDFTIVGEGVITIDLVNPEGRQPVVTGGVIQSLSGDILKISVSGAGSHTISVKLAPKVAITSETLTTDTGESASDLITNNGAFTLEGTVSPAAAKVEVYNGVTKIGDATVGADGKWTFAGAAGLLPEGPSSLNVKAFYANDPNPLLTSTANGQKTFVIDTTPPTPGTLSLANLEDTGSPDAPPVTKDKTFDLSLSGAEQGATIVYQMKLGDGPWTNLPSANLTNLDDGSYQFRAVVTDKAGNLATTNELTVVVDNTAPAQATLGLANFDDTGLSASDRITSDRSFDLTLTNQEPGSTVVYQMNDGSGWASLASPALTDLPDGSYTFRAIVTDKAGNSSFSTLQTVTISGPNGVGTFDSIALTNDTGESATDFISQNGEVTLTGTGRVNGTVHIYDGGQEIGSIILNGNAWTWTKTLNEGSHDLTVQIEDVAGNMSPLFGAPSTIVVDNTAPDLQVTSQSLFADTGRSSSDKLTKDARVVLGGSAVGATSVQVLDGGNVIATVGVQNGGWSWTGPVTGNGVHELSVRATDKAGNVDLASVGSVIVNSPTTPSGATTFGVIDTLAPKTPVTKSVLASSGKFTIQGTAEANSTVKIYDGSIVIGTATAASNGTWSLTKALKAVKHVFWADSTDAAGNVSVASNFYQVGTLKNEGFGSTTRSDIFRGSGGVDTFAFKAGMKADTILDFNAKGTSHDILKIDIGLFGGFGAFYAAAKAVGSSLVVNAGNGDTLTLRNVSKADLDRGDVVFSGKTINGTTGANKLTSTTANEILTGKAGSDAFVFKAGFGRDSIRDFQDGPTATSQDTIWFSKSVFANFSKVLAAAKDVAGDVVIKTAQGDQLTIWNTKKASLTVDDFKFF